MAGNWNRCLDAADTDLVNLLHNDDELLPNYVAVMLPGRPRVPDAAAFFCKAKVIDAAGRETFSLVDYVKRFLQPRRPAHSCSHGESAIEALMHGDFIMCPTVCYRRSRLPAERFRAEWNMVLDLDFFTRILLDRRHDGRRPEMAPTPTAGTRKTRRPHTDREACCDSRKRSRLHDSRCCQASRRDWPKWRGRRPASGSSNSTWPSASLPGPGPAAVPAGPEEVADFSDGLITRAGE